MRKNERIEIGGVVFTLYVNKPAEKKATMKRWDYLNIWYAYERPSQTKVSIWEDWKKWFLRNTDSFSIWVSGRNSMQFTISGWFELEGKTYNVYITKTRNDIFEVI